MKPYRLSAWGDFRVHCADADCTPRGRKARALIAYLGLHPEKEFRRERIAELLWTDRADEQARTSLRQVLAELKPLLSAEPPLFSATRNHIQIDARAFDTQLDNLRALAEGEQFEALLEALPEPGERLFADLDNVSDSFHEWLAIERARKTDQLSDLVQQAAARARARGEMPSSRALQLWLESFDVAWDGRLHDPDPEVLSMRGDAGPQVVTKIRSLKGSVRLPLALVGLFILLLSALAVWTIVRSEDPADAARIAVLPFQSMSAGDDSYLADGISEEIMTRLAHNPNQQVIGRTSAWSLRGRRFDAKDIGRRLGVDYLVEGSVRSTDRQLRVDVSLIQVRNGAVLWTERFVGNRHDIFAIQDRIGERVSARLKTGSFASARPTDNQAAHALVLTARGLLRSREPAKFDAAIDLLRRATALDPNYAEAWAILGRALIYNVREFPDSAGDPAVDPQALAYVRRAIALRPNLAEAHLVLGIVPGPARFRRAELIKAVQLDPGNSENWFALSRLYRFQGEYGREFEALKRGAALDPLWHRVAFNAAEAAWDLGLKRESDSYSLRAERGFGTASFEGRMQQADRARRRGDYSESLAAAIKAAHVAPRGRILFSELLRGWAYRAAGDYQRAGPIWRLYRVDAAMSRMWRNLPPSPAEVSNVVRDPAKGVGQDDRMSFMLATLINAGRHDEVVQIFDAHFGSPAAMATSQSLSHGAFVRQSALYALALRESGRVAASRQLLDLASRSVERVLSSGAVPSWYYALSAQLGSVAGKRSEATRALALAHRSGWLYPHQRDSFSDIGFEPAFQPLRGNERFDALRATFNELVSRERLEMQSGRS